MGGEWRLERGVIAVSLAACMYSAEREMFLEKDGDRG
jgi:hypothetical protein